MNKASGDIITEEGLKSVLGGSLIKGTFFKGVLLLSDYSVALTKDNKEYIKGKLQSGVKISFKAWGTSSAFLTLKSKSLINTVVFITGTVDNYQSTISLTLDSVCESDVASVSDFLPLKYNADAYYNALMNRIRNNVSSKAMTLVSNVMTPEVVDAFKLEFAASSHHDNCRSGLLAHTYKCVCLMTNLIEMYPALISSYEQGVLTPNPDRGDLLYVGTLLHDIGKIREMNLGVYQNCSKVTHRYLGVEYINPFKDYIIENFGEPWYYDLISILLQHHGEYGDPCRSVCAYIVSKVDLIESQCTFVQQLMEESVVEGSAGRKICIDGVYLALD